LNKKSTSSRKNTQ